MLMRFINRSQRALILGCLTLLVAACTSAPTLPVGKDRAAHDRGKDLPSSVTADSSHAAIAFEPYSNRAERQAKKAEAEFSQALALMAQQQFQEASKMLSQLAAEYPLLSGPLLNLGIIYLHQEEPEKANAALAEALRRHPENPYAYLYQGIALKQQGKFKQAEESYLKAIDLAPNYAQAHINVGILYELYLQEPDKALPHYENYQSLQQEPDPLVNNWIMVLKQ